VSIKTKRDLQASQIRRQAHLARERNGRIPFPPEYKEALLSNSKSVTLRVDEEMGVYQEGLIYEATSYEDDPWGIFVLVLGVHPMQVDDLTGWGIPDEDIERTRTPSGRVELIKFHILQR